MATFLFRGVSDDGYSVGGSKKAKNEAEVKAYCEGFGVKNCDIYKSETKYKSNNYGLVSPKELSIFCKQMSVLFFSHMTLMEGITMLSEQTENRQLKIALNEIYGFMEKGFTFAEAMSLYPHIFGAYLLNMIGIGESSGTLDKVFLDMSIYFEKESKIRKKAKSAVVYPATLSVLMAGIILILITKILPMFDSILAQVGANVPASTEAILKAGMVIQNYFLAIIIIIFLIVVGITYFVRTEKGSAWFDKVKMKIPGFSYINSRIITARFARSLAILIRSGIPLLNAMEDVLDLIDNDYIRSKFIVAIEKLKDGEDLPATLEEIGIFPKLFIRMIVIGNSTGHLDEILEKSATLLDEEVEDSIERTTSMIEPTLIIILSIAVGIILISVMLPMINIMQGIGY